MTEPVHNEDLAPDAATQAFESLRAEVASLTKAIQGLPVALSSQSSAHVDYSPSFGVLTKTLQEATGRLGKIEEHPSLKLSPDHFADAITRAGAGSARDAIRAFRSETDAIRREREQLTRLVGDQLTEQHRQRKARWLATLFMLAGLILYPLLASIGPGGSYLAAWATGNADRWQAGASLMQVANPDGARSIFRASRIMNTNIEALKACTDAAKKAAKEVKCSITVGVE